MAQQSGPCGSIGFRLVFFARACARLFLSRFALASSYFVLLLIARNLSASLTGFLANGPVDPYCIIIEGQMQQQWREESEKRESVERRSKCAKTYKTLFFPMIAAPGGRK